MKPSERLVKRLTFIFGEQIVNIKSCNRGRWNSDHITRWEAKSKSGKIFVSTNSIADFLRVSSYRKFEAFPRREDGKFIIFESKL